MNLRQATYSQILRVLESAEKSNKALDRDIEKIIGVSIHELRKTLQQLQENGIIDLDERIDIRNNRDLERAVARIEEEIRRKLLDRIWTWNQIIEDTLRDTYKSTYFFTLDYFKTNNIQPFANRAMKNPEVVITDTYITESKIKIPWCKDGKIYSDRLYGHVANFSSKLAFVLEEGLTRGKGLDWMIKSWRKLTGTMAYDAARLIKTESMAFWSRATKDSYLGMGIEYVEIVNDSACGEICLDYVSEGPIPLREAEIGDLLPPYHPNCACSFVAYTDVTDDIYVEEDITD